MLWFANATAVSGCVALALLTAHRVLRNVSCVLPRGSAPSKGSASCWELTTRHRAAHPAELSRITPFARATAQAFPGLARDAAADLERRALSEWWPPFPVAEAAGDGDGAGGCGGVAAADLPRGCGGGDGCWGPPPSTQAVDGLRAAGLLTRPAPGTTQCATLLSAAASGAELEVVGWGAAAANHSAGGGAGLLCFGDGAAALRRISVLRATAERHARAATRSGRQPLLLLLDSSDVIVTAADAADIVSRWRRWSAATGRTVAIGGDGTCYCFACTSCAAMRAAAGDAPFPFPNTGMFMGPAADLAWLLRGMERAELDLGLCLDDQTTAALALEESPLVSSRVAVDARMDLAATLHVVWRRLCVTAAGIGIDGMNSTPFLVHMSSGVGRERWLVRTYFSAAPWYAAGQVAPRLAHPVATILGCPAEWDRLTGGSAEAAALPWQGGHCHLPRCGAGVPIVRRKKKWLRACGLPRPATVLRAPRGKLLR